MRVRVSISVLIQQDFSCIEVVAVEEVEVNYAMYQSICDENPTIYLSIYQSIYLTIYLFI